MVYTLFVHNDAYADLADLEAGDPDAAALIVATLDEISEDQALLDALTIENFGARRSETFEVKKWWEFWKSGSDIWRLRIWALDDIGAAYRVVYAYERGKGRYHVLGIFPRNFNYDPTDPRTKRVINAYQNL